MSHERGRDVLIHDDIEKGDDDVEISFVVDPQDDDVEAIATNYDSSPNRVVISSIVGADEEKTRGINCINDGILELYLSQLRRRSAMSIVLSTFFFCWSLLSFIIFPPLLGFYGVIIFTLSGALGLYLFSDKVLYSGIKERCLIIFSFTLNFLYSLVGASTGLDEDYDVGQVAFSAICALIWIILGFQCQHLLGKIQDHASDNDKSERS